MPAMQPTPDRDPTPHYGIFREPVYFGVHPEWVDIPNDAFADPGWIDHCETQFKRWHGPVQRLKNAIKGVIGRSVLPAYLALPLAEIQAVIAKNGRARVLDVGGGFGDNYFQLAKHLPSGVVDYHVVDNARQCDLGRKVYQGAGPEFHTELPAELECDLLLTVGTLQYMQDWRGFLQNASTIAQSVYISRTPLRLDGPTFITVQSISPVSGAAMGAKIGEANVSVIGVGELEALMAANGYALEKSRMNDDKSSAFGRLPESHRNVAYVDKLWRADR